MKNIKIFGALTVAGVVAMTGSAFTASNTLDGENLAGFGSDQVSGAATSAIEHTLIADGTEVSASTLTFTTDLPAGAQVVAGFGVGALQSCDVVEGGNGADLEPDTVDDLPDSAQCDYVTRYSTADTDIFKVAVS